MKEKLQHINAFIIDPNVLIRRMLSSILKKEEVLLSGSAGVCDVEDVLEKVERHRPNVLFLGIKRSDSNEMELFYRLRNTFPDLHIVFLTDLNPEGALVALQGLKEGAIDYITKPDNASCLILADRHFQKRIIPSIIVASRLDQNRESIDGVVNDRKTTNRHLPDIGQMNPGKIELIVFGSCLGGIPSLFEVVSTLPERLPVPVVIVHHMPKIYTNILADELNKVSQLTVTEAINGSQLIKGNVYVAPGGYHSVIKNEGGQKQITLHKGPREHKCRPSIDVLLRSAVQEYGEKILAVFLSGGGSDGVLGALRVLERGGILLVESPETALVPDLGEKVLYLNSNIQEVPAVGISKEIMNILQSVGPKRKYRLRKQKMKNPDLFTGSFDA